jgi:hypothetical protein
VIEGVDALFDALLVRVYPQLEAVFRREPIAEGDHFPEFPGRVDVQQGERQLAPVEGLARQVHHHRRVFADRIQHHRPLELGNHFTQDVDALRFQLPEMREVQIEGWLEVDARGRHEGTGM